MKEENGKKINYGPAPSNTACTIDGVSNSPCIGHALFETKGWYGGLTHELGYINNPWYIRGGGHPDVNFKYSSIFASGGHSGNGYTDSFRIVLTPNN